LTDVSLPQYGFEIIEHPADMGLQMRAQTLEQLFVQAALGLTSILVDIDLIKSEITTSINLSAPNSEELMYKWLSEILYLFDGEQKLFNNFDVSITKASSSLSLSATACGEPYDKIRHQVRTYVKAITYHQLSVKACQNNFEAKVFLDI
jgi:SHS2 domain-containing protein